MGITSIYDSISKQLSFIEKKLTAPAAEFLWK